MITENIKNTSVYLIKAGQTDNYKIGIASDTGRRLANLQTAHYEKLSLVCSSVYSTRFIALAFEDYLHEKYNNFNTQKEATTKKVTQPTKSKNVSMTNIIGLLIPFIFIALIVIGSIK